MAEIEIGLGKAARRAYSLDEITIVPSRRTRDSRDVNISWEIDAYKFELPVLASATDAMAGPATAIQLGEMGACGVLNLDGLWTRYEDPNPLLDELAEMPEEKQALRLMDLKAEPIQESLITERVREIKQSGVITAASIPPQIVQHYQSIINKAELDLLIIRGAVTSAEHVSKTGPTFDMKAFIREFSLPVIVGDCSSYQAALHLMRTGAAGVLVGAGGVPGVGVPQATAVADARGARMRHLDETGIYCHVIADGGMKDAADVAKALVCGADSVMLPAHCITTETFESLRESMATTGYESLKDFQKAEIVVTYQELA